MAGLERKVDPTTSTPDLASVQGLEGPSPVRDQLKGVGYEEGAAALKPKPTDGAPPEAGAEGDEKAKEEKRKAEALAGYKKALGSFLGTKLYEVIHKEVAPEKLLGYGGDALDGLLEASSDQVGSLSGKAGLDKDETAAVAALTKVLGEIAKEKAEQFLASPEGQKVLVAIRDYVEDHPWQLIAAIIVAAAGAVAANVDIPTLNQKVKLADGLTADATAKLGKIRDISLAALQVGLTYETGKLKLRGEVSHTDEKGTKGQLSASYGDDKSKLSALGTMDEDGNFTIGLNHALVREHLKLDLGADYAKDGGFGSTAKLHYQDGNLAHDGEVSFRDNTLTLKLSDEVKQGLMTYSQRQSYSFGDTDAQSMGFGAKYQGENTTAEGNADFQLDKGLTTLGLGSTWKKDNLSLYGKGSSTFGGDKSLTDGLSLNAGGKYTRDDLTAMLDLGFKGGDWTAKGEVEKKWGNFEAGASTEVRLNDTKLLSLGAHFGYSDPEHFRSFLVDYKRTNAADVPTDVFNARLETKLSDIYLRVQNETRLEGGNLQSNTTSAHAGYFLNPDLALIGGGQYTAGDNLNPDQHRALIQAGVQVRNVPVLLGFDPNTKGWTIGLTIPFGGPKKR